MRLTRVCDNTDLPSVYLDGLVGISPGFGFFCFHFEPILIDQVRLHHIRDSVYICPSALLPEY